MSHINITFSNERKKNHLLVPLRKNEQFVELLRAALGWSKKTLNAACKYMLKTQRRKLFESPN